METITKQKRASKKSLKHIRELSKLKSKFIEYFSELPIQKLAAKFIGKSENTICNWKKNDKRFCDRLLKAESQWALDNARSVKSKEWLLERIMKEHFGESVKVEFGLGEQVKQALDYFGSLKR